MFIRYSLLICNLLLVALLTSVFSTASTNSFTYLKEGNTDKLITTIKRPVLDCQHLESSEAKQACQQAWYDIIKSVDNSSKTSQQCQRLINLITLFPATSVAQLNENQITSLAPINDERPGETHSFTESIYRPPIV